MTKRNTIWTAVFVFFIIAIGGLLFGVSQIEDITITQERIQGELDKKMPMVQDLNKPSQQVPNLLANFRTTTAKVPSFSNQVLLK